MKFVHAIAKGEFLKAFQKCRPPNGWKEKIAIANSGGPDSTCLLFLINRCIKDGTNNSIVLPRSIVSLTVDHNLQQSSSAMAEHCSQTSQALGVEHLTARIPWSQPPFPARPETGEAFENTAREARFHLLFHAMSEAHANVIAFGHHADDQVETSLMRLARGTTELGAGGMRRCRRWGMGLGRDENSLGWAGYAGLDRWVVRPLLEFGKDRLLATCEENHLEYVTDKTNFQPEATFRNAVRLMLAGKELDDTKATVMADQLLKVQDVAKSLQNLDGDISIDQERLRGAVQILSSKVEDVDDQVDNQLHRRRIPSPCGTFLLSSHDLSSIKDETVRYAMVLRILRYVSFYPWGSIRADGNRRKASLQQIVDRLWTSSLRSDNLCSFVAGGGVLWTPVVIRAGGKLKRPETAKKKGTEMQERLGWLASRQPPLRREKMLEMGMTDPLQLDLTNLLAERLHNNSPDATVLYDCRFLLRFDLKAIPEGIRSSMIGPGAAGKVLVQPQTKWYWPTLVWHEEGHDDVILASNISDGDTGMLAGSGHKEEHCRARYWGRKDKAKTADWVHMEWTRPLDAI